MSARCLPSHLPSCVVILTLVPLGGRVCILSHYLGHVSHKGQQEALGTFPEIQNYRNNKLQINKLNICDKEQLVLE